jgi:hypothetical protein
MPKNTGKIEGSSTASQEAQVFILCKTQTLFFTSAKES